MSAELLDFANLTARRKADRERMALRLVDLADEYKFAASRWPEQPGTKRTAVDLEFPRGLKLTVKFDASPGGTDPDTYVLSWYLSFSAIDEGTRLHPGMFGHVNPYGGHKATDVACGFAQLVRILRERFAAIRDDSAFILADYLDGV